MNRKNMRPTTVRLAASVLLGAAVLATAAVVATSALAQNRPDSTDRRDRGAGRDRNSGGDRTGGGVDRSRRPGGQPSAPASPSPTSPSAAPVSFPSPPAAAAPAPRPMSFRPSEYSVKYALLDQKNVFQKVRVAWKAPTDNPFGEGNGPDRRRAPEESLVLTGIALQEGRHVAFVENTSAYTTARLTPGGSIANGKIVAVERDHVEYEANGQHTRVEIGQNFAGGLAPLGTGGGSAGMNVTGATSAASGTSASTPLDPNNPNLSVEEKMKLRRQQEQQKK